MTCPLDYSLCDRTVTVYRKTGDAIDRTVVEGCFLEPTRRRAIDTRGRREEQAFLLIMPGALQRVFPGDRIYDGVGPTVTVQQWAEFVPAKVPGLGVAAYATPFFWEGRLCHVEAGRK